MKYSLISYISYLQKKNLSENTIKNYEFLLKHYIHWLNETFKDTDYLIITEQEKSKFVDYLKQKNLTENTIKQILKRAKEYTIFIGGKWITVSKIGQIDISNAPYSKEQIEKILNILLNQNKMYYYISLILYGFGIKINELQNIYPKNFKLENNITFLYLKDRKIPSILKDPHLENLNKFIEKRKHPKLENIPITTYYNDLQKKLVKLNPKTIKVYFNNLSTKLNIEISSKKFRHTYICYLLEKNISPIVIAKWTGIKNIQSICMYYQFIQTSPEKELKKLT